MDKSDYKHISIRGDGNCLFNSISKFLELDKYLDNDIHVIKPNQLRKLTVQWIRKNLSYRTPSGLTITDDINEYIQNDRNMNSINDYLEYMNMNKSFAGQIELYAISNLLNRSIRTYIEKGGNYNNIGLGLQVKKKEYI